MLKVGLMEFGRAEDGEGEFSLERGGVVEWDRLLKGEMRGGCPWLKPRVDSRWGGR